MKSCNFFFIISLSFVFISCGSNSGSEKKIFSIAIPNQQTKFQIGETLTASITNLKQKEIDSVVFFLNNEKLPTSKNNNLQEEIDDERLGNQVLKAIVHYEGGKSQEIAQRLVFLNNKPPKLYKYALVATYPHDQEAFTQGLEFKGDTLYESTGKNGYSSLRKVAYTSGKIWLKKDIDNQYFAEGITIINDKILQLTWKSKEGFIYDSNTLEKLGIFAYDKSKEGWGLCNDGTHIYKSDGTEKIWLLDPETLAEKSYIEVTTNTGVKSKFNELEWVEGKIYANTWQKDGIAIINPKNGALEGVINLKGLRNHATQHDQLDVLNGIAYRPETKQLFVTGKNWDKLFEIRVVE